MLWLLIFFGLGCNPGKSQRCQRQRSNGSRQPVHTTSNCDRGKLPLFTNSECLLACSFASCSQQVTGVALGMAAAKDSVAGYQQLRSCLDDLGNSVVSHPAVDFNFKLQTHFLPELGEPTDLVEAEGDK